MLDRVALHQTHLRTPGVSLDASGVALGSKGVVLFPTLDRLVGFLALYTAAAPLDDLLPSLTIEVVKSQLGAQEMLLSIAADNSERMDRVAALARVSSGYTFTGSSRHFVQYRDAAAPFGYDVQQISATDAPLALYHSQFSQYYAVERKIALFKLLLRLQPRLAPSAGLAPGPRWICAEAGLGAALIHYFVRSQVAALVGVAEWPPASAFEQFPLRRYLFKVDALPARMVALMRDTPGVQLYVPEGDAVAVEVGYRHPIHLRACPVFPSRGLTLIRGGAAPILVDKLPALGPVDAFAKVLMHQDEPPAPGHPHTTDTVAVDLRLAPDPSPWQHITATFIAHDALGLLRQLAYRLGNNTLKTSKIAFTPAGAFVMREQGVESIPLGEMFRRIHPNIVVAAGYAPIPAVSPEVLHRAFGSPRDELVFVRRDGTRVGVALAAFVPLEDALLDAHSWHGSTYEIIAPMLRTSVAQVLLEDPGFRPLRDVADGVEEQH